MIVNDQNKDIASIEKQEKIVAQLLDDYKKLDKRMILEFIKNISHNIFYSLKKMKSVLSEKSVDAYRVLMSNMKKIELWMLSLHDKIKSKI